MGGTVAKRKFAFLVTQLRAIGPIDIYFSSSGQREAQNSAVHRQGQNRLMCLGQQNAWLLLACALPAQGECLQLGKQTLQLSYNTLAQAVQAGLFGALRAGRGRPAGAAGSFTHDMHYLRLLENSFACDCASRGRAARLARPVAACTLCTSELPRRNFAQNQRSLVQWRRRLAHGEFS